MEGSPILSSWPIATQSDCFLGQIPKYPVRETSWSQVFCHRFQPVWAFIIYGMPQTSLESTILSDVFFVQHPGTSVKCPHVPPPNSGIFVSDWEYEPHSSFHIASWLKNHFVWSQVLFLGGAIRQEFCQEICCVGFIDHDFEPRFETTSNFYFKFCIPALCYRRVSSMKTLVSFYWALAWPGTPRARLKIEDSQGQTFGMGHLRYMKPHKKHKSWNNS